MSFVENTKPTLVINKELVKIQNNVERFNYTFLDNNELLVGRNILYSKQDYDTVVNKLHKTMIMTVEKQLQLDEVKAKLDNYEANVEILQNSNIANMEKVLTEKHLLECRVKELEDELNKFNQNSKSFIDYNTAIPVTDASKPIVRNQNSLDKGSGDNNGIEQLTVNINGCLTDPI